MPNRFPALVASLLLTLPAHAAPISGKVISVADGDTLTVLDSTHKQHKIRIAEIDAPEKAQPFGNRSKQSLAALCFQVVAEVRPEKTDRYGRTVGRVSCNGQDVSAHQISSGMAWVYVKYSTDASLLPLEQESRAARRGLWADVEPVPPWEWRKNKRK